MARKINWLCSSLLVLICCQTAEREAFADRLRLRDGSIMEGEVVSRDEKGVQLKLAYGEVFIASDQLASQSKDRAAPEEKNTNVDAVAPKGVPSKKIATVKVSLLAGEIKEGIFEDISYLLYFPSSYNPPRKSPMIVALDPSAQGEPHLNLWKETADKHGYLLLCPSNQRGVWRMDEDGKIARLARQLSRKFAIDHRRIFATGFSGGGVFTYLVGINHSDVFAAIAPVCSAMLNADDYLQYGRGRKLPVLILQGSDDEVAGRQSGEKAARKLKTYGYPVTYKIVQGMGHESRMENTEVVVSFFNAKRR